MVCFQRRRRDGNGSAKALLRLVWIAIHLAHDAKVVQRVGEVPVERAEARLLQQRRLAQKPFAGRSCQPLSLFSRFDGGARFA